jgi:hypothetical protein
VARIERTGSLPPLGPEAFTGYTHRPAQLRAELTASGLQVADLVVVEGAAILLADLEARLAIPADRRVVLETARALERVPELLGLGPHLLATGIAPKPGGTATGTTAPGSTAPDSLGQVPPAL